MASQDRVTKAQDYRHRLDNLTESILTKSSYTINQIQDTLKQLSTLKHHSAAPSCNINNVKLNQLTANLGQYQKFLSQLNTLLLRTEFFEDQLTLFETDIAHTMYQFNANSTWDDLNLRTIESTLENLCLEFKHLSKRIEGLAKQGLLDIYSGRLPQTPSAGERKKINNKRLSVNTDEIVMGPGINTIINDKENNLTPTQIKRHSYSSISRLSYHSMQGQRTPRTPLSQTFNANDFQSEDSVDEDDYKSDDSEGTAAEKFMSHLKPIRCVSIRQASTPNLPSFHSEQEPPSSVNSRSTSSTTRRTSLRNSINSNKLNLLASIPKSFQSSKNSRFMEGMDLSTTVDASASASKEKNAVNHRDTLDLSRLNSSSGSFQTASLFSQTRASSIDVTPDVIQRLSPAHSLSPKKDSKMQHTSISPLASKSETNQRQLKYKAKSIAHFHSHSQPQPQLSPSPKHNSVNSQEVHPTILKLDDPFKDRRKKRQSIRHFNSYETGLKLNFGISSLSELHKENKGTEFGGFLEDFIQKSTVKEDDEEDENFADCTDESVTVRKSADDTIGSQLWKVEKEPDDEKECILNEAEAEDFANLLEHHDQSPQGLQILAQDDEFATTFEHKLNRSNSLDSIFSVMTSKIPTVPVSAAQSTSHNEEPERMKPFNLSSESAFNTNIRHMPSRNFSKPTLTWMRNVSQSSQLANTRISHQPSISNMSTVGEISNGMGISLNKVTMVSVNTPSTRTFALNSKTKQNLSNLLSVNAATAASTVATDDKNVNGSRVSSAGSVASNVKVTESTSVDTSSRTKSSGGSGAAATRGSIFNRLFSSSSIQINTTSTDSSSSFSNSSSGYISNSTSRSSPIKPSALSSLNKNMLRHQKSLQSLRDQEKLEQGDKLDIQQVLDKKKSMKSLNHKPSIMIIPPTNSLSSTYDGQQHSGSITTSSVPITISHSSDAINVFEQSQPSSKYINNNILDSFITKINSYIPSNQFLPVNNEDERSSAFGQDVKNNYVQKHRPTSKIDSVVCASASSGLKFVSGSGNVRD